MASSSYSDLCREIRLELTNGFERQNSKEEFATRAMVEAVMPEGRLRRVYESLRAEHALPAHDSPFGVQEFIKTVEDRKLRHFLAVLMCAKCSINAAKAFVQKIVQTQEVQAWPKENPYLLPATKSYLEYLFDDPSDANDFFKEQRPFCTIVVGGPEMVKICRDDQRTLPWLSEKNIGQGAYGVVFRVEVPKGHLTKVRDFNQTIGEPEVIARKDFITETAEKSFQNEWQAIKKIFDSRRTHENIVKTFGTIEIEGQSSFSLLMPLADMDLGKYMELYPEAIVHDIVARQNIIKAAMGLADGLEFLHSGLRTGDGGESLICYHMDLKPGNILIFGVGPNMSWKLSDFGLSRVKPKTKPDVSDLSRIFKKREHDQQSRATPTANIRGHNAYLPREAEDKGKTMDEKSDIWSLGCIISLLFTFMENGRQGIAPFSESREKHSNISVDVFYQRNKTIPTHSINKGVTKQHDKLIELAKERSVKEGDVLSFILKWLEENVLVIKQDQRSSAMEICQRLKRTCERYEDIENAPMPQSSTQGHSLSKKIRQVTGLTFRGSRRSSDAHQSTTLATQANISQWRLEIEKGMRFNGSDSSPDGAFLIYWNSQAMKLFSDSAVALNKVSSFQSGKASTYSAGSSSRSKEQVLTSLGQHMLQRTKQSWRCGALTERYLIAATMDDTFKCYIFDIETDKTLQTYNHITLAKVDRGIHKLITPCDRDSFACILHDGKDNRCSILIAKIHIKLSPQLNDLPASSRSILESHHIDAGISLVEQTTCPLGCSTSQIKHVELRTRDEVYVVVQRSYDVSLYLFTIKSPGVLQQNLNLQASGDNGERLFTDMICFPNADAGSKTNVIVVAQRETIFHFTFDGAGKDPKVVRHQPVTRYRILKIARSESGSIVALGRHSGYGSSYIVLLSVKFKGERIPPELTKLAELEGVSEAHHPKLSLLRGGNGFVAQVTATTPDGQYRFYRLDLSGLVGT